MSLTINDIPHVVFRELFRTVNLETLFKCRRVCKSWNREIQSMNYKGTQKVIIPRMLIGVDNDHLTIEGTSKRCYSAKSSEDLTTMLRHFKPPDILLLHSNNYQSQEMFKELMNGLNNDWCDKVKELEIGQLGNTSPQQICKVIHKFSNIYFLNIIWQSAEFSCSQVIRGFEKLRFLRIYQQSEDDSSQGLYIDKDCLNVILQNQIRHRRLVQHIELCRTAICFDEDDFFEFLNCVAKIPVHPDVLTTMPSCVNISSRSPDDNVYISFFSCHFKNQLFNKLKQFHNANNYIFQIGQTSFNIFVEP